MEFIARCAGTYLYSALRWLRQEGFQSGLHNKTLFLRKRDKKNQKNKKRISLSVSLRYRESSKKLSCQAELPE